MTPRRWVWVAAGTATICAAAFLGGCAGWIIASVNRQQALEGNPTRPLGPPRSTP